MQISGIGTTGYLDKSDFFTHLNYARRMAMICHGMNITTNTNHRNVERVVVNKDMVRFAKLSELTARSIESDVDYIKEDIEYSSICAPWFPVKCYYRLYYLESILLFLKGNDCGFKSSGHHKVRSVLNAELRSRTIKYNTMTDHLGVLEIHECINFTGGRSASIKKDFWKQDDATRSLLKLLARYKFESWKVDKKLRTAEGQKQKNHFNLQNISVFDYAYQMRLKANYKDLNFLDPERISPKESRQFVGAYNIFYSNYSTALVDSIRQICPDLGEVAL